MAEHDPAAIGPAHGHGAEPAAEPGAPDPSMEDILASIRRILNEEGAPAEASPAPHEAPAETVDHAPGSDVLELDHTMLLPDPEPTAAIAPAMVQPPAPAAVPPPPAPAISAPAVAPPAAPLVEAPLVAPAAAAAAASSVGALMRTLAAERGTQVHRGGPTIEDLVREEIRPLLKDWLDAHLPPVVERLVRAEIERVVSRTA